MVTSMQQILPIVWNTLTESAALYPLAPSLQAACALNVLVKHPSGHMHVACNGAPVKRLCYM